MKVVTSGSAYLDIDAYAGAIAYAELLQAQGENAAAVSTAPLNESITKTVRSWQAPLKSEYTPSSTDTFALVDVSDPHHFDTFVDLARVDEVIDHHPGFEEYWQERIGERAQIEFIGSACTFIYERWKAAGLIEKMSLVSARLLLCAILENTLNFWGKVTTQRDRAAYDELLARAQLPGTWAADYFSECQEAVVNDLAGALRKDTKTLTFQSFDRPVCFGQLVVWDGKEVLAQQHAALRDNLAKIKPECFTNLISVGERCCYFITGSEPVQQWLSKLLGVRFDGSVAVADRLWLRKEVIRQDIQRGG